MTKIAICDNLEEVSLRMKKVLLMHTFAANIEVDYFVSGMDLYCGFIKKRYDIVLLEIELSNKKDENGMSISNMIKDICPDVIIIFFTGQIGYELELLNFEPFRFLRKPIEDNELIVAVNAAIKRLNCWEDKYFAFKYKGIKINISIKEIMFLVSQSPYVIVKCIDDQTKFRAKIDDVEQEIGEISSDFVRISKSYLVNKRFIKGYTTKEITLSDGEKLPVSRKYKKQFIEKLENK